MKKRTLLFLFALLSTLTASAQTLINGIYYNLDASTNTATVTSGSSKYTGSVNIPETVTYSGVTYSVTSIGSHAFSSCSGLTSVNIPNSVTSIGREAFYCCSSLTSVTIPNSVTSIGIGAFWDCKALISVIIPNSVTSIGDGAFYDCSGLTSVTIPNSVTSIGSHAFDGCSYITSVTIPNSVTSIGISAFQSCKALTSVIIPNSVTSIGSGAFQSCKALISVTCEATSVPSTGYDVFANSPQSSATLYVPASALDAYKTTTPWSEFGTIKGVIPSIVIPSIDGIYYSFDSNMKQATVISGDTKYTGSVTIPETVTYNGVTYSVTIIGSQAFYNCTDLTEVTIGNSVTSIGRFAFSGCSNLTSVTCEATSVPSTESRVFYNVPQSSATLYVPASALDAYKTASQWSAFGTIEAIPDAGLRGDANGDGEIGMPDVMFVVNYILGNPAETFNEKAADANLDGEIGMPDVMFIVNYILNGKFPDEE